MKVELQRPLRVQLVFAGCLRIMHLGLYRWPTGNQDHRTIRLLAEDVVATAIVLTDNGLFLKSD